MPSRWRGCLKLTRRWSAGGWHGWPPEGCGRRHPSWSRRHPSTPMTDDMALKPEAIVNGMSIDVEDYFHVSVFDGLVPRAAWDGMESRVCRNTDRLLTLFDEA